MGVSITSQALATRVPNATAAWVRWQAEERGLNVSNYLADVIRQQRVGFSSENRRTELS